MNPENRPSADVTILSGISGSNTGDQTLLWLKIYPRFSAYPIVDLASATGQTHHRQRLVPGLWLGNSASACNVISMRHILTPGTAAIRSPSSDAGRCPLKGPRAQALSARAVGSQAGKGGIRWLQGFPAALAAVCPVSTADLPFAPLKKCIGCWLRRCTTTSSALSIILRV